MLGAPSLVVLGAPSSVHEVDAIYRRPSLVGDLQGPCHTLASCVFSLFRFCLSLFVPPFFPCPFYFLSRMSLPLSVPLLAPVTSFLSHFLPSSISSPSPTFPPLSPPFLSSLPFLILSSPLPFFFPLSVSSSFRSHMLHAIALSNFFLAYIL